MKQKQHDKAKLAGDRDGHEAEVRDKDFVIFFSVDGAVIIFYRENGLV